MVLPAACINTDTDDALGRLVSKTSDSDNDDRDYTDAFTYDLASNRLTQERTSTTSGANDFETTYTYDANDRLLSEVQDYTTGGTDSNTVYAYGPGDAYTTQTGKTVKTGTTVGSGTLVSNTTYHYDATGRMVQVDLDTDGDGNVDSTQTYSYDARGLRVSQTDNATGETTTYLFDPQNHTGYAQVLEEWTDSGSGATLEKTYTLGHDVIAQASAAASQILTLLHDGHGNTRAVVDEVGDVIQRYAYDAYGVQLEGTGLTAAASALTTLLYSGEAFNAATGLQYLRARWYNPSTGTFNRLDPFAGNASDPVSLHKYLYAHANPVMGVDPSGEFTFISLLANISIRAFLFSSFVSYVAGKAITAAYLLATQGNLRNFKILEWTDLLSFVPGAVFAAPLKVVAKVGGVALARTGVGAFIKSGSLFLGKQAAKTGAKTAMSRLVGGFTRAFAATGGQMQLATKAGQKLYLSARGFQHIVESHIPKYFDEAVRGGKQTTSFFPPETSASQMLDMLYEATQKVSSNIVPGQPVSVVLENGLTVRLGIRPDGAIGQFFAPAPQAGVFTLTELKSVF